MNISLSEIRKPIELHMEAFEKKFQASMKSNVPLLDKITHYIVKRKGKQMRPMFVFLCAGIHGNINESTHRGAALIELLHTATLVHDDVVDDSNLRRGFFSINALWKNKIAVLVGDYLLSKGLLLSIDNGEFTLLQLVSEAVRRMSEGELLQIEKARKLDIEESVYFEIITNKTASLIAACCAVGTASAGANPQQTETMRAIGNDIGIAFQIKDDLFDYMQATQTGKPSGIDIKERKMTLPIIYTLKNATKAERNQIIYIIKNQNEDVAKVAQVLSLINKYQGIEYATKVMEIYCSKALTALSILPDSSYKSALTDLIKYTINRTK
ncbi:MAG: polyprenyl synthetase family protein [Bacteroidia bacterium]|nr:polyprenyl synthetase family protein [Bacteroidia bacterium]HQV00415.1 polyprenyl synthetase family protein [Bacteroidia bacterium]